MVRFKNKSSLVSNLIDRYNKKINISSRPNFFTPLPAFTFLPSIAVANSNMVSKLENKNVKGLTKIKQNLVLSVRTI